MTTPKMKLELPDVPLWGRLDYFLVGYHWLKRTSSEGSGSRRGTFEDDYSQDTTAMTFHSAHSRVVAYRTEEM
jgi:hypothetical protein